MAPIAEQLTRGMSIREFAEHNSITVAAVRRMVYEGRVPSYKVGGARRIPVAYLQSLQQGYDATIKALVDAAPKLSAAQRDTLAALLADDDSPKPKRRNTPATNVAPARTTVV